MLSTYTMKKIALFDNRTARLTAAQVKAKTGADIVFNGGFFDNDRDSKTYLQPYCPLKIGGVWLRQETWSCYGYAWNDGEMPVVQLSNACTKDSFISCLWGILNGQAQDLIYDADVGGSWGRTAFGFRADGKLVVLCTSTATGAMTPEQARDKLLTQGCISGIVLDGGGSSQIIAPDGTVYSGRIVSNLVCVWLYTSSTQTTSSSAILKYGSRGDAVKALQTSLNALGYSCGTADGIFGAKTLAAATAFQRAHSLTVDGIAGPLTQAAILTAVTAAASTVDTATAALKAKGEKMLDLIEAAVGDLYIYGAQGQSDISATADWSAKCFPAYTTAIRAARMKKYAAEHPTKANGQTLRCEDCSGLFWAAENQVELPLAAADVDDSTAQGLYAQYCDPVQKSELRPLDLVFAGSPISHVAVVGRNGKIYEAAGADIGVACDDNVDDRVVTSVYGPAYGCAATYTKDAWTAFGRLKIFKDIQL